MLSQMTRASNKASVFSAEPAVDSPQDRQHKETLLYLNLSGGQIY